MRRRVRAQKLKTLMKKEKVEAHLGEKDYYCNCVAGNSKGVLAHSKNADIRIAYFKTEFRLVFKLLPFVTLLRPLINCCKCDWLTNDEWAVF